MTHWDAQGVSLTPFGLCLKSASLRKRQCRGVGDEISGEMGQRRRDVVDKRNAFWVKRVKCLRIMLWRGPWVVAREKKVAR